ncbi:hypothetical protein SAMN03159288_05217 [Rhizobium sp. NFACC06-2]|nr:hypothetical protein SAMN03159288_05217 [Rhizobium sp. NFACC06-2]
MITVPYFDGAEVEFVDADLDDPESIAALETFLSLTKADRYSDARHVLAYYKDYSEEAGKPDWLEEEIGTLASPVEIWRHVTPGPVVVENGRGEDENRYVVMEAECAWNSERGLMLVWRNGTILSKVGGYNGHVTNANAYRDETLKDVVYKARNSEYTTRLSDHT